MRGQPLPYSQSPFALRIIPARAGPTGDRQRCGGRRADHPRSCGANPPCPAARNRTCGSSPLVRGQPINRTTLCSNARIIPARAGPTSLPPLVIAMLADHPRSCGANRIGTGANRKGFGSSPLVRGQQNLARQQVGPDRIIPARAGPTGAALVHECSPTDHPRSCGANSLILRGKSGLSQIKIFDYSSGIWQ